jgi:hypothetical protein
VVTTGGTEALYAGMQALLNLGDECIMFDDRQRRSGPAPAFSLCRSRAWGVLSYHMFEQSARPPDLRGGVVPSWPAAQQHGHVMSAESLGVRPCSLPPFPCYIAPSHKIGYGQATHRV